MDLFLVQGGRQLSGRVAVSGSKNATLPIMAAALAADGETVLENVPDLADVRTLSQLLRQLGMDVAHSDSRKLTIRSVSEEPVTAGYELVRKMRASVCVLGPLLARRGEACVSLPGGCNIGNRPIDLHLKGLAALGAEIDVRGGNVHARAKRLRGASIFLGGVNGSTVTGTCNVMTAAALAEGKTTITAAACEPEVVALADALNAMGACISGQGTPQIEIEGVARLSGTRLTMIPDRVETATLLIAAAMTRGEITLTQTHAAHLTAVIDLLEQVGCSLELTEESIMISARDRHLTAVDFTALPYPGIPTDVQAQLTALACTLNGTSVVTDHVFPERFMHVSELSRMGAKIRQQGATAVVTGATNLTGAPVVASDLRGSAALVLAGLTAEGETAVRRIHHLDRGYEQLELKLRSLGAVVSRLRESIPAEQVLPLENESDAVIPHDSLLFPSRKTA